MTTLELLGRNKESFQGDTSNDEIEFPEIVGFSLFFILGGVTSWLNQCSVGKY